MRQKLIPYIYILFSIFNLNTILSQEYTLYITSKNKIDRDFIDKIDYRKNHKDSLSVRLEVLKIHNYLKNEGYFTSTIDSIKKIEKQYTAYFTLNQKLKHAILKIHEQDSIIKIPIEKLQQTLKEITSKFDQQGKSFSKLQLVNLSVKNNDLYADLLIKETEERKIDDIFIKNYETFPKSFLKHYLKINKGDILSREKMDKLSIDSKNISFVREIKSPEILFTKDSTKLYLYLEKTSNNSIDAIVNFASQDNGDLLFTGNIDLRLENILNTGEQLNLFWNSIGNERQEFKLSTQVPYIFNSIISPEFEFSLYRQDSTFTSTKLNTSLNYNINSKLKIGLFYSNENSENLLNLNNTESFKSNFFGFNFSFKVLKNDLFRNKKLYFNIKPTYGNRKSENVNSSQFKITSISSYLWELSNRSSIYIKNETGILNSDQYFNNELYRIGGVNSIRGFNEQSIFTRNYSYFNLEYRLLTSTSSYLYTISDIGIIENDSFENILGLGLGYLFINNNSNINIGLVVGKPGNNSFDFDNVKVAVSWTNYF